MKPKVKKPQVTKWQGIPSKRFVKYRKWINREKPGICGTYTVGVLLDDFLKNEYNLNYDKEELIEGLRPVVDLWLPYRGTFIHDLVHGLNFMLEGIPNVKASFDVFAEMKATKLLSGDNPRPVIIGTNKFLGSAYGNHWVVAYQYGYDKEGELWFKVTDNHGRYKSYISIKESLSCIWIQEKSEDI